MAAARRRWKLAVLDQPVHRALQSYCVALGDEHSRIARCLRCPGNGAGSARTTGISITSNGSAVNSRSAPPSGQVEGTSRATSAPA